MRLLNLRINLYLLRTFCPHLGSFFGFFCVVSSFTTFRPNFTSGLFQVILPRPWIGMMNLLTVFPVITAFHSCFLSHHVFDQRAHYAPFIFVLVEINLNIYFQSDFLQTLERVSWLKRWTAESE